VPVVRTVEPDPARADRYDRLYRLYRQLHPQLVETMHALGRLERGHQ
jgi:xylulokinase